MTLDLSFNLPQFDEEYEGHKMRVLVEELERLHAMLTNDTNADGIQVVGTPGETIIFEGDTIIYESTTSLVYPNCAGINWLNIAGSEIELLKFCEIAATGPTSNFGSDPSSDWTYSGVVATSANLATGGIENDSASKFLSGVAFSPDGLHALTGNSTNDRLWTYTLTTPYDFENATVDFNAGLSGIFATNVWNYQFINDGNYALVWDFDFNQLSRISLSPPYTIDSDFALVQSKTGVGLGYTASTDAWVWMAEDGLNMISIGDKGGGVTWMRSFTLSTAFDLTTLVFANELNFDAVIGTPNSIRNIVASPDGLSLFIMHQASTERIELVTMTTPWDVSTGTVTGTYLDIDATAFTSVFDFMEVASDGGAIYVYTNAGDNRFVKYSRVGGAPAPPTSGAFYVGDPGYPLELDGTLIGLKNNIGINWDNVAGDNVELLNFEPVAATGDPYWASVAVLARLDGSDGQSTGYSTQDSTAFTTSFISSASLSSDQVPFTSLTTSLKLDGGSMYMVISNSSNVFLAGSDFTVEGWGYYTADPTTGGGACLMSVYSPSPNREWIFSHRASGKLEFIVSATGSSNIAVISETFVPTLNQWYHLRVTRSGNSWRLFIDGVQLGSTATNSTTIHSGTGGVQIGSFVGGFERWAGYISNARITIGVARSIANFTPPTDSFPVVLGEAAIPESLYVGDPAYPTIIDGLTTNITSAATDIDGNVDIAGTLHAGGAVDFNSTLDVLGVSNLLGGSISGDPGTEGLSVLVNDVAYSASSKVSDIGGTNAAQFLLHRHSTTLPSVILGVRSKTDDNTHAVMADNDVLMTILAAGWDGVTTYSLSSEIRFEVDGTPGNNNMPGQITFMTAADGTQTPLERMRIRSTGDVEIDNALDITGALTALSYGGILEANLLDKSATEAVSGAYTFSGGVTVTTANIVAGTVDADFGAITGTSYGGITEANLLDKVADETVTGTWTIAGLTLTPSGAASPFDQTSSFAGVATHGFTNTDSGTTGAARIFILSDDVQVAMYAAGTGYTGTIVTGGPTGGQAALRTLGAYPIVFGTNNTSRMEIGGSGGVDITGALTATSFGGITEANLLDKTATETVSGAWTFTGNEVTLEGASPRLWLKETGGFADEQLWRIIGNGGQLIFEAWNDAVSVATSIMTVDRTGTVLDSVTFGAPIFADAVIKIKERASAAADTSAYGQFWVKNDSDMTPCFTDDSGTDRALLEGSAQRGVIRSVMLFITPGTTPGTNFDIVTSDTSGRSYNSESSGITNATDLSSGGTSGSFTANTNSRTITMALPSTCLAVLNSQLIISDANNSTLPHLKVDAFVTSSNIQWSLYDGVVTQNHATMMQTGDLIRLRIVYVSIN